MARTRMASLPWMIRTLCSVPTKFFNSSRKQIFRDFFLFYHGIVCFMYSIESPHRGDSNEYTQYTIIVWKIQKISLNYRYLLPELVPWLPSVARTTDVSNEFPWSQRCSSHGGSTVLCFFTLVATLKGKKNAPSGSKFFPLRVAPIS